jgi:hypothetical protein
VAVIEQALKQPPEVALGVCLFNGS